MAGELSTIGANIALDAVTLRGTGTTYIALLTAAPTDATTVATMVEVTTAGYARQPATWSVPAGDPSSTQNTNTLTFGPFTADPPNIPYAALVSSSSGTGGNFLAYWTLNNARDAAINDSLQAAPGDFVLTLD